MRKTMNYGKMALAAAGLLLLNACGTEPEPPTATLPDATGTVEISFLNYPGAGNVTTTASAGDVLAIAVQVQKTPSGNRPQKLRVYETNILNTRGTQVGSTIDLRNTDVAQIKNINYTVPQTTASPIYLYFEVDESASAFSRKVLVINVSGAGTIGNYTGIVLGAQTNSAASRLASSTGQVYSACDASSNISDIDITYAAIGSPTAQPTLLANPERARQSLSTTAADCGTTGSSTAGGPETIFAAAPTADFNAATDASLQALTITGTAKSIQVTTGSIVAFQRADGKKGLIRVNSFPAGQGTAGSVSLDVKVQR